MRLPLYILIPALLIAGADSVRADRPEDHPGYVDFSAMTRKLDEKAEANVEVYLKNPLLRLVAEAARYEEPELAEMLTRLQLIQVQAFPLDEGRAGALASAGLQEQIADIAGQLEKEDWEKIARVREKDQNVYLYVKTREDAVIGLVVMAVEAGKEVVFVNIVGHIDPAQIGRIGRRFDISPLDSLRLDEQDL